jgi:hypothetical protein
MADVSIYFDDYGRDAAIELIADLDCDGLVTFLDIEPFVMALFNPDVYETTFPDCARINADVNRDDVIDFFDIGGFARLLVGG